MDFWTPQHVAFIVGMLALTGVAAYTDLRYHRIKNWLTIPFFVAIIVKHPGSYMKLVIVVSTRTTVADCLLYSINEHQDMQC